MSDSLQPHGLQNTRLFCPSLSPGICLNWCSLSPWCYLIISPSASHFFCLRSFPASGSFPMSQLFTSGSQSIGASASAPVLPMNIQSWFPGLISFTSFDWFDLLAVQGTVKGLIHHNSSKASILWCSNFFMVHFLDLNLTTGNTIALTIWTVVGNVMSVF